MKIIDIVIISIVASILANLITHFFTKESYYFGYAQGVVLGSVYVFLVLKWKN